MGVFRADFSEGRAATATGAPLGFLVACAGIASLVLLVVVGVRFELPVTIFDSSRLATPVFLPNCSLRGSPTANVRGQVLGALYPVYRRPAQVARVVASFRRHYPDSPLVVFGDGGDNFTSLCERQRCTWHPNPHIVNPTHTTRAATVEGARELLRRNFGAFRELYDAGATHALLLEDDVRVLRPIEQVFTTSITGWVPYCTMKQFAGYAGYLKSVGYSDDAINSLPDAGYGGCVFDLDFFTHAVTTEGSIDPLLKFLVEAHEPVFVTDYLFSTLTYSNPPGCVQSGKCGTTGPFPELATTDRTDFHKHIASGRAAVAHGYKDEYEDAVDEGDKKVLGWIRRLREAF